MLLVHLLPELAVVVPVLRDFEPTPLPRPRSRQPSDRPAIGGVFGWGRPGRAARGSDQQACRHELWPTSRALARIHHGCQGRLITIPEVTNRVGRKIPHSARSEPISDKPREVIQWKLKGQCGLGDRLDGTTGRRRRGSGAQRHASVATPREDYQTGFNAFQYKNLREFDRTRGKV